MAIESFFVFFGIIIVFICSPNLYLYILFSLVLTILLFIFYKSILLLTIAIGSLLVSVLWYNKIRNKFKNYEQTYRLPITFSLFLYNNFNETKDEVLEDVSSSFLRPLGLLPTTKISVYTLFEYDKDNKLLNIDNHVTSNKIITRKSKIFNGDNYLTLWLQLNSEYEAGYILVIVLYEPFQECKSYSEYVLVIPKSDFNLKKAELKKYDDIVEELNSYWIVGYSLSPILTYKQLNYLHLFLSR